MCTMPSYLSPRAPLPRAEQAATGDAKWWNVTTGGTLQAAIELVTADSHRATAAAAPPQPRQPGYSPTRSAAAAPAQPPTYTGGGGGSDYGGNGSAGANPSPHVPVAHATPSGNLFGGAAVAAPTDAPPPPYEVRQSFCLFCFVGGTAGSSLSACFVFALLCFHPTGPQLALVNG